MLYMRLPLIKGFHYEINMDESYAEMQSIDDMDAAYLCDGNQCGCVYEYCYDGVSEMSTIYKSEYGEIDTNTYTFYEIDFSFDNWKEKLIDAMIEAYHEFFKEREP